MPSRAAKTRTRTGETRHPADAICGRPRVRFDIYLRPLYLHVGPPREPARAIETSEGHTVEYDEEGAVIGLELLNVRWTLEREGTLTLTWPRAELSAQQLDPVVAPA